MWMRQMTLGQIDLEGNGFHEALNAFIIFHTMESLRKLKTHGLSSALAGGEITVLNLHIVL